MWRPGLLLTFSFMSAFSQERPAFEVAAVYPSQASGYNPIIQIEGANVIASGVRMDRLITVAYGMRSRFHKGPDWIKSNSLFDIRATMPKGAAPRLVPGMLQGLLEDRFHLRFHVEQQERTVYALVVKSGRPQSEALDEY
ncbi:MAG: TIGR03435 family protein [Acidobacteriota bacterium]